MRRSFFYPALAIAAILAALLSGCATNTGDASVDRRGRVTNAVAKEVFNAVLHFGLNEGRSLMAGQNGQDAAAAAFDAATGIVSSDSLQRVLEAYAGPQVAVVAAEQFDKADPKTPAEKSFIANVIGAGFQLAANQLAK